MRGLLRPEQEGRALTIKPKCGMALRFAVLRAVDPSMVKQPESTRIPREGRIEGGVFYCSEPSRKMDVQKVRRIEEESDGDGE